MFLNLISCSQKTSFELPIEKVFYGEVTDDGFFWGEPVHGESRIYALGIQYNPEVYDGYDTEWKSINFMEICTFKGSKIIYGSDSQVKPTYNSEVADYYLRLEAPLDPEKDADLKLHFNIDYDIEATQIVAKGSKTIHGKISTKEKLIDFSAFESDKKSKVK
jgi:hypothetical protein